MLDSAASGTLDKLVMTKGLVKLSPARALKEVLNICVIYVNDVRETIKDVHMDIFVVQVCHVIIVSAFKNVLVWYGLEVLQLPFVSRLWLKNFWLSYVGYVKVQAWHNIWSIWVTRRSNGIGRRLHYLNISIVYLFVSLLHSFYVV